MPAATSPTPESKFCEWYADPNHFTLLRTPAFVFYGAHLGPNGLTKPHAHRRPTSYISFLSASQVLNQIYPSSPTGADAAPPAELTMLQGAIFNTVPPVDEPYVHAVTTNTDPVLFAGLEALCQVRREGRPAAAIAVPAASGVETRPELLDSPFSSAVSLTLQPGAAAELRTPQRDGDRVLVRIVCRIGGPALQDVHVRDREALDVKYFEYAFCDPGFQAFLITGFSSEKGSDALCALHNLAEKAVDLAVVDVFTLR